MSSALRMMRPTIQNSVLLLCDMQEKFASTVSHFKAIVNVSARMLEASRILNIPCIATEQYPKGLGHTVPELKIKEYGVPVFSKTCFSMAVDPVTAELGNHGDRKAVLLCGIEAHACVYQIYLVPDQKIKEYGVPVFSKTCFSMAVDPVTTELGNHGDRKAVLLCGIEAHACVYQTTLDLLEKGYEVFLVVDAVSSRNPVDRMFALRDLERQGARLITSECALLLLLKDAGHPDFKQIQKLIMDLAPDSGLLHDSPKL